jgi:molybdate transport system substrate-binding protein
LTVRFNFAGSQQLALQIEQGAPADVFASADQRWMSSSSRRAGGRRAGRLRPQPLVAIVPRTNPARIGRLEDLARRGTKIVLAAEAVPVGKYSRRRWASWPGRRIPEDYDHRVLANVVSQEENVKSVVAKVQLGEADAGIVYRRT